MSFLFPETTPAFHHFFRKKYDRCLLNYEYQSAYKESQQKEADVKVYAVQHHVMIKKQQLYLDR